MPTQRAMLKKHNVSVAHCPNSNFALSSGIANVHRLLADGIRVGLGTDVSGGYSVSMLDALRQVPPLFDPIHSACCRWAGGWVGGWVWHFFLFFPRKDYR